MPSTKETLGYCTALSSVALIGNPASAAIVNLTFTPNVLPYQAVPTYGLSIAINEIPGAAFFQFNDTYGRSIRTTLSGTNTITALKSAFSNSTVDPASTGFYGFLPAPLSFNPVGTQVMGFKTASNQVGWVVIQFGPLGGSINYLAGAFNTTPGDSIVTPSLAAIPETSTSIALAGLSMLAAGVGIREKRRRRKAREAAAEA